MAFIFKKAQRQRAATVNKARRKKTSDALRRLRAFLDATEPATVQILMSTWGEQQAAITYKEIREAILSGSMTEQQLDDWRKSYAALVNNSLTPQWEEAYMMAAQARAVEFPFLYEPSFAAARRYSEQHGAELVTRLVTEQRDAIQSMISQALYEEGMTADSLSRLIRPVVGLTQPQAAANLNYYNAVVEGLMKANPTMRRPTAEKRAAEAAAKYADKQHRYRAQNIARTELAFAYNRGGYDATVDAQERGYIGDCKKTWHTADDDRVCEICGPLDGESVNMNAWFSVGVLIPPAHPSCRCAVAYEEITEPVVPASETPAETGNILTNTTNSSIMDVGVEGMDVTGAHGAIPRSDYKRMGDHAERYYESVRKMNTDVLRIAENTDFSAEDVEKIKRHVFIDTHALGDEIPERFTPNYDMAVSWQRLIDGRDIREMDIVLLNHELTELTLMAQGHIYDKAHEIAQEAYNYTKYVKELDAKEGIF